jgi:hypothetical protein
MRLDPAAPGPDGIPRHCDVRVASGRDYGTPQLGGSLMADVRARRGQLDGHLGAQSQRDADAVVDVPIVEDLLEAWTEQRRLRHSG